MAVRRLLLELDVNRDLADLAMDPAEPSVPFRAALPCRIAKHYDTADTASASTTTFVRATQSRLSAEL